jgi:hypothetical protein
MRAITALKVRNGREELEPDERDVAGDEPSTSLPGVRLRLLEGSDGRQRLGVELELDVDELASDSDELDELDDDSGADEPAAEAETESEQGQDDEDGLERDELEPDADGEEEQDEAASPTTHVRFGALGRQDEASGPAALQRAAAPARISAKQVTFRRFPHASNPARVAKWIRQAARRAGGVPSPAWVKGYKTIIARESSGNCNACNVWDSNAITPPGFRRVKDFGDGYTRNGIVRLNGRLTAFQCSRGIVQCIPQTFAHYHARGTTRNIYDPVASIAASMRYVMSRYKVAKNGSNLARKVQQADPTRPPKGY